MNKQLEDLLIVFTVLALMFAIAGGLKIEKGLPTGRFLFWNGEIKGSSLSYSSNIQPKDGAVKPIEMDINPEDMKYHTTEGLINASDFTEEMTLPLPTRSEKMAGLDAVLVGFYLQEGTQTKLEDIIKDNADNIEDRSSTEETVKNIMAWLNHVGTARCDEETKQQLGYDAQQDTYPDSVKRTRTAGEIIKSKCFTGCIDYALAFAALARAKGISASFTETVKEEWVMGMIRDNKWNGKKEGHVFSEFYNPQTGAWMAADPASNKISAKDKDGKFELNSEKYILFERGLDSWDYGIKDMGQFEDAVKSRYNIPD